MKIFKEPMPVLYCAEIKEYCCENFKHYKLWFNIRTDGVYMRSPERELGYAQSGYAGDHTSKVNYCPFCGEKIEEE